VFRLRLVVGVVVLAALGAAVTAQDKQKFEMRLKVNEAFYQKMETKVTQVIKVQGQDLTQKQESTFFFKWTPEKQEGDKWTIKQKVEGLIMSIDISGNPITYNSTLKEQPGSAGNPGLMDFFKNLEGSEFTVNWNGKDSKVESVTGKDDFIKKLGSGSAQMDSLLKKIMTDDALKQMADPTYGLVPDQPKAVNETWEKKQTLGLGPIGAYEITYKFTYKGKDMTQKDFDRIEVNTSLLYKPPTEAADGLLFRIKGGTLTSETPEPGVILYNPKVGRIEKATIKLKIKGELTVTIGGTDTKVELSQEQVTIIDTADKTLMPEKK
jgi:hypothetical protein